MTRKPNDRNAPRQDNAMRELNQIAQMVRYSRLTRAEREALGETYTRPLSVDLYLALIRMEQD